eukprot:CAMPEP_0202340786 /NCGR_PEP_ID=MMETSP1126-20121109/2079_1 /ASSEMBLY_ACC=CAM_ASM_000457 /TAXON_ID=3047 /ORGANISM="Dunaliella tertiolecta, Strain CCMP1320" /LENGTH=64 /DNA_ID=CAMNT_0048931547 /DNA_START=776 /DNA_END=970 /DNA_ORIENTATION=-
MRQHVSSSRRNKCSKKTHKDMYWTASALEGNNASAVSCWASEDAKGGRGVASSKSRRQQAVPTA